MANPRGEKGWSQEDLETSGRQAAHLFSARGRCPTRRRLGAGARILTGMASFANNGANGMPRQGRAPSCRKRARHHQARLQQQQARAAQVNSWIATYGRPGSGKLERHELAELLHHIHPEAGEPDPRALDLLIVQATEVKVYSLHLKGDPNGAVGHDMLMSVVSGYSTFLLASAAFDQRSVEGVVRLRDLPALMRHANGGMAYEAREVDFVLDCTTSSIGGAVDSDFAVERQDLVPAMTVMAMKVSEVPADLGGTGPIQEEEDSTGTNDEGGSNGPGSGAPPSEEDAAEDREEQLRFDDIELHLARLHARTRRSQLIQAYARRLAAVKHLQMARAAVTLIQSAARGRAARIWLEQRRAAAALILRIARVKPARRQAQRRREAATTITRVAKGRVTRKLMSAARSTGRGFVHAVSAPTRSRTMNDFFGLKRSNSRTGGTLSRSSALSRSNTAPVTRSYPAKESRACVIS